MNFRNAVLTITVLLISFYGCKKSSSTTTCANADALNYNKPGSCVYPKDSILAIAHYKLMVTKYTLDPTQVGTQFYLNVSNGSCLSLTDSQYQLIELDWDGGYFEPFDYCVVLNGFSFTIPPTTTAFTWAGAPVSGTGQFINGGFQFSGTVHSSYGDSAIVVQSY